MCLESFTVGFDNPSKSAASASGSGQPRQGTCANTQNFKMGYNLLCTTAALDTLCSTLWLYTLQSRLFPFVQDLQDKMCSAMTAQVTKCTRKSHFLSQNKWNQSRPTTYDAHRHVSCLLQKQHLCTYTICTGTCKSSSHQNNAFGQCEQNVSITLWELHGASQAQLGMDWSACAAAQFLA